MRRPERAALLCTLLLLLAGTAAILLLGRRAETLERVAFARRDLAFAAAGFLEECKSRAASGAYGQDAIETAQSGEIDLECTVTARRSDAGVLYDLACTARTDVFCEFAETSLYVPYRLGAEG